MSVDVGQGDPKRNRESLKRFRDTTARNYGDMKNTYPIDLFLHPIKEAAE